MRNYIQIGDTITAVAPTGGVTSGDGVLIGSLFGVAAYSAAAGEEVELRTVGVFTLPKAAGAITFGSKAYFDGAAGNITGTATGNKLIGATIADAATGDATTLVRLNGVTV